MSQIKIPLEYIKIASMIEPNSSVLDLGCGRGELLSYLIAEKSINGQGVEIDEDAIYACVEKGLTVFHSDIEGGLDAYPDESFDYIIMHNTMQEVRNIHLIIEECFRAGKKLIITFPNFVHIKARLSIFFGRMPITKNLPYQWFNTPNVKFLSINDFKSFCAQKNYEIFKDFYFNKKREVHSLSNLRAESAVFMIGKQVLPLRD
ncbi:MAG: methionine biosynthesis protein MetW [Elusimicrobiota bacterium]|jgi:methionine biosynthesis protein MetW|nr:methionine biosynthesis protein MetW [Elusimicrobiota bacterium]